MGTTAQKLNKIIETKEAIRTAINNKGGTLTTTDTFASYPTAIDNLPSGGGDPLKEYLDETKDASYMFCGFANNNGYSTWYYNLTYERLQKILSYDTTSNVTNMNAMFYYCNALTTIPLIDTSLVTDMSFMFSSCLSLTTIPQLDTSNVTNMSNMFDNCNELITIPQLDTISATDMSYMFQNCTKLTTIPQLNTSNAKNIRDIFYRCTELTTIDITHMNITSTNNISYFAGDCHSLTKLIIRNMPTIPVLNKNSFYGCFHFKGTTDPTYNPQGLKDGRIYVPDDKVDALKTATNWSVYADIIVPLSTLVE